jgi:hypothetical protein
MMGFSPSGGVLSRPFFVSMAGSWGIVASITTASDVNNTLFRRIPLCATDLDNQTRIVRFVPGKHPQRWRGTARRLSMGGVGIGQGSEGCFVLIYREPEEPSVRACGMRSAVLVTYILGDAEEKQQRRRRNSEPNDSAMRSQCHGWTLVQKSN